MNKSKWLIGSIALSVVLLFGLGNLGLHATEVFNIKTSPSSRVFKEECGVCHIAYPAKLLPKESWTKLMGSLENHFDENAEVDAKTGLIITTYLVKHSSNSSAISRFNNILKKAPKGIPLRITELPYFIRKHDEIPQSLVRDNPTVKGFSQCDKCHSGAERGYFDEGSVSIPGHANWED